MCRVSGRVLWTVAALAMVTAMAHVAEAQREGGRRGGRGFGRMGFGISPVQLAAESEEVQAALKLTDQQKTTIGEINDELSEARRDLFQGGGGGREERQKLDADAAAKLAEVLDETQKKRLMGIQIQVNGANSLFDAAIAKELSISDDQNDELSEVRDSNMEAAGEAMRDLRDQELSREEMMAKFQEIRAEGDKKLLAVLTSDQQTKYEALKGDPVEVDMSQFRGFGRGGFGGGRGRDGDGGGRRRNRDAAEEQDRGA
jgi:hypothetical protein